jgi:probable addiction module antidote protein
MLRDFNETFGYRLLDPNYLDAFLLACLEEGPETLYVGLRRAVLARPGGFTWLAAETGMGRESLYKALSAGGNPSFKTVRRVIQALNADARVLLGRAEPACDGAEEDAACAPAELQPAAS